LEKTICGPGFKKWKQEQIEKQNQIQPDPVVVLSNDNSVITQEPVPINATPLVKENDILPPNEEKVEEPESITHKRCFGIRLEALEEMGFTDKGKNVKALVAAKGNPRIAVSILLDQGQ